MELPNTHAYTYEDTRKKAHTNQKKKSTKSKKKKKRVKKRGRNQERKTENMMMIAFIITLGEIM